MSKVIKNALPKSAYEYSIEYMNSFLGDFDLIARKLEKLCGKTPDFKTFALVAESFKDYPKLGNSIGEICLRTNILFHYFNMYQNNKPTYYVTPQLAVELAKTKLNVDTEFILSPFREIFIQLDPGLFSIKDFSGEYPVTGIYVFHEKHDSGVVELRIMVSALKIVANKAVDDLNFYFKLFLKPGKVKDSLKQCLEEENMSESNKELHKTGGFDNIPYIEDFTSFVVNLLLYLTSKEPDILKQLPVNFDSVIKNVKNRAKLRKIDKIRERSTEKTIMVVGSHLPKNTDEFNQIKDSGGIGGWKLKNKVKVSAHWRTQWYGSTKDGTRRSETIRVQEYDKGPDAAEYITKKRVVV